jgi:hypothetical protein
MLTQQHSVHSQRCGWAAAMLDMLVCWFSLLVRHLLEGFCQLARVPGCMHSLSCWLLVAWSSFSNRMALYFMFLLVASYSVSEMHARY